MFGWVKKIGKGLGEAFKEAGKGAWWATRRPEVQIAISALWPGRLTYAAINVVKIAESKKMSGKEKKEWALGQIAAIAIRAGFTKRSDWEKLIEDALAVVEGRAQMLEQRQGDRGK